MRHTAFDVAKNKFEGYIVKETSKRKILSVKSECNWCNDDFIKSHIIYKSFIFK